MSPALHDPLDDLVRRSRIARFHLDDPIVQVVVFLRAYNQRKKLNPSLKHAASVSGSRSVAWARRRRVFR